MNILIKTVRIAGFRGLKNIEIALEQTTILTGMNNTGKTSFLKALHLSHLMIFLFREVRYQRK
jgi:putative ATP-dependent endonuclease of OLD family